MWNCKYYWVCFNNSLILPQIQSCIDVSIESILGIWEEGLKSIVREAFANATRVANGFFSWFGPLLFKRDPKDGARTTQTRTQAWKTWWQEDRQSSLNAFIASHSPSAKRRQPCKLPSCEDSKVLSLLGAFPHFLEDSAAIIAADDMDYSRFWSLIVWKSLNIRKMCHWHLTLQMCQSWTSSRLSQRPAPGPVDWVALANGWDSQWSDGRMGCGGFQAMSSMSQRETVQITRAWPAREVISLTGPAVSQFSDLSSLNSADHIHVLQIRIRTSILQTSLWR